MPQAAPLFWMGMPLVMGLLLFSLYVTIMHYSSRCSLSLYGKELQSHLVEKKGETPSFPW